MSTFKPSLLLSLLLCLFVGCSQGILIIQAQDSNETFANGDFYLMPNNYSLSAPLLKPKWLEGDCQLDIDDQLPFGKLLFFDWTEIKEKHGCKFIHQLIEGIKVLSPAVSIFSSNFEKIFGDINHEPYGFYDEYRSSGLSLTFVEANASAHLRELFLQSSNVTCFVSHDEGPWLRAKGSPLVISHIAICISLLSIGLFFIVYRLALKVKVQSLDLKLPTMVYICALFFCVFKILDLAVDPFSLYGFAPFWLRSLFYWSAYAFGYNAFALIGISWIKIATSINLKASHKKVAIHLSRYSYFTIFYWGFGVIGIVLYRRYSGSGFANFLGGFVYLSLLPMLAINSVILLVSGIRILFVLHGSILKMTASRKVVFKRITILLLFCVFGFLCLLVVMGLNFLNDFSLQQTFVLEWLREICGIGLLIAILLSLNIHPEQSKDTSGSLGSNTGSVSMTAKADAV